MSEAITKAQPSAEFNGDWLLREVRFNAQGAVVDWRLPAQPAPSPQPVVQGNEVEVLRAMVRNYRRGHNWDHLDADVCKRAADLLAAYRACPQPAVPVVSDEQIRKTVEAVQDPDTVPAFHNGYYTLTPDELRRAILALRPAVEPMTNEQQPNPFSKRCYTMSESHLSGYRLIVGFEHLEDAQDAHTFVANTGRHHGITAKAEGGA